MARPPAQKPRDSFRISAESWNMFCSGHQPRNPEILSAFLQNPGICTVQCPPAPQPRDTFCISAESWNMYCPPAPQPRDTFRISAESWNMYCPPAPQPRDTFRISAESWNMYYCTVQQPRNPGCFPHFCRSMVLNRQTSSKTLDAFRISAEATSA